MELVLECLTEDPVESRAGEVTLLYPLTSTDIEHLEEFELVEEVEERL